jgi:hypothetical protein
MRVSAVARLAAAASIAGCLLEPAAGMEYDDEDDASQVDEEDEDLSHRAALRACEADTGADARLSCLQAVNDVLAAEVMQETGSEAVVLPPLQLHREYGRELCGWLAEIDGRRPRRACEAELELMLGELMDVYLEHQLYTAEPPPEFGRCRAELDDAMRWTVNDLERTLVAADFAECVENVIADAAPELNDGSGLTRADDPRLTLLTERAPGVADQICILLTVRDGTFLPADRVLRCHAQWQIEMFSVATGGA